MKKVLLTLALLAGVLQAMPASNRITLPSGRKIFVSGMNMAWINYGNDVGDAALDTNTFKQAIQDIRDSGGNAMRIWLSTNGSHDPKYDANTGLVNGIGSKTVQNVKAMLSIANRNGVVLALDLLTHNLISTDTNQIRSNILANNIKLLSTDTGLAHYIHNAVVPLVTAIGKDTGILCWEVFNEPEGMIDGWSGLKPNVISMPNVQKAVNRIAGAIHRAVPGILVSNGSANFEYLNNAGGKKNQYTDSALKAAGGDADGYMDFYMVHFYGWNGTANSPFAFPVSHWNLDKPVIVGEFPAKSWSPATNPNNSNAGSIDTAFSHLYNTGYAGGLSWCYVGDGDTSLGNFSTTAPLLSSLYNAYTADIKILDVNRVKLTGNGVLAVNIDNDKSTVYPALKLTISKDFSKNTSFSFDILVPTSATGGAKVTPVFQTTSANWNWNSSGTYCAPMNDSSWSTCTAPLADFKIPGELGSVMSILFQLIADPTFHGQVWFDNIRIDSDTLWNFNDGKTVFGADIYDTAQAARITGLNVTFPQPVATSVLPRKLGISQLSLRQAANGFEWVRTSALAADATVRVIDTKGRELFRTVAKAGSLSGYVPAVGSGLRFVVLESAQDREVRSLTSTR